MKIQEYPSRNRSPDPYQAMPRAVSWRGEQFVFSFPVKGRFEPTGTCHELAAPTIADPPYSGYTAVNRKIQYGADPYRASRPVGMTRLAASQIIMAAEVEPLLSLLAGSLAQERKTLASFIGRVESLHEGSASVSLLDQKNKERFEADCDAEVLKQNGISEGDEFTCEVIREGPATTVEFKRLLPKPVPLELLQQIEAEVKARWD